jgi:hypothetical protein
LSDRHRRVAGTISGLLAGARDDWGVVQRRTRPAGPGAAGFGGFLMRYALLWLLGVPIPLLIVIWLFFH